MNKQKVIGVHLLNDFSGSPLVFSNALDVLKNNGAHIHLITSSSRGFLSNKNYNYHYVNYSFKQNIFLRLFAFICAQILIFFKVFSLASSKDIVYINTLLPATAAIAAKIKGAKVVYHIHETSLSKTLKSILKWVANNFGNQAFYVSRYLLEAEKLEKLNNSVLYNSLSNDFLKKVSIRRKDEDNRFSVLMLCSLKGYKGVFEFVKIAHLLPQCSFELVLNAPMDDINNFFTETDLPKNLKVYPSQSNVHPFYKKADLLLNLSHPDGWIETFGMTILEGFAYALPCIAPPIGGPTELVVNGQNGYLISSYQVEDIAKAILELQQNKDLYNRLSTNALLTVKKFQQSTFEKELIAQLNLKPVAVSNQLV